MSIGLRARCSEKHEIIPDIQKHTRTGFLRLPVQFARSYAGCAFGFLGFLMPSPAFQFYPNEWIGNYNVQLLSLEEEGAYIRLLCYCWNEGSIPNDPELCARLIGKGASTTLATKLLPRFVKDANDPSRLVHERLEREREKQLAWSEKSKLGGQKSGESRKKAAELKGGSRLVEPPYEPKSNSSFSSSSSSSKVQEVEWTESTSKARIALAYLGQQSGGRFRESAECLNPIADRIFEVAKDYASEPDPFETALQECKKMINRCVLNFKENKVMQKCLTPMGLFGEKFPGYFGQRDMPIPSDNPLSEPFAVGGSGL